jgi:hypothetical protein
MKVEEGGVHCKRYDVHCMKQWVKISMVIWTTPILGKRFTCWTSINMASLMKDNVNDEVSNGTTKTLILLDGVLKSDYRPKGDHATHLWGWIKRPITQSSVWKCPYANDKIKRELIMWVSSIMDGKKKRGMIG